MFSDLPDGNFVCKGTPESYAVFSPCERYRYELGRVWDAGLPALAVIGLNPSTADESVLDPTLTRVRRRAEGYGYGGFLMLNLFAYRATDPRDMKAQDDPIGPENDRFILHRSWLDILCGWGVHGSFGGRYRGVLQSLQDARANLYYLEMTKGGHPKHPLYLSYQIKPKRWVY